MTSSLYDWEAEPPEPDEDGWGVILVIAAGACVILAVLLLPL